MMQVLFRDDFSDVDFPLFDCHINLGESDSDQLYYPHLSDVEYLRIMDRADIARACALPVFRDDGYRAANRALAELQRRSGRRILALARLGGRHLPIIQPYPWRFRRKLNFILTRRGSDIDSPDDLQHYAGIKLSPHMDGLPSEDEFAAIRERRLPVLIHAGSWSSPRWIEKAVLPKLGGCPLIMAHLGAFPCDEVMARDAVAMAERYEHLYLDTSGVMIADFIRWAAARVPSKLLFGSDAPLAHPRVAWYHHVSVINDDALLERIGYQNAAEMFG